MKCSARNHATPSAIEALKIAFAEIGLEPDPESYYQMLMRRTAERDDDTSGLGLCRIRAEANMKLRWETEGNVVTVIATTFEPERGQA